MKAKACKDCKYVKTWKDYDKSTRYECRFNSPTAMSYRESSWHEGRWPGVLEGYWCWQFKDKDEEVAGGRRWDDES
jgi:hypothetical protein